MEEVRRGEYHQFILETFVVVFFCLGGDHPVLKKRSQIERTVQDWVEIMIIRLQVDFWAAGMMAHFFPPPSGLFFRDDQAVLLLTTVGKIPPFGFSLP